MVGDAGGGGLRLFAEFARWACHHQLIQRCHVVHRNAALRQARQLKGHFVPRFSAVPLAVVAPTPTPTDGNAPRPICPAGLCQLDVIARGLSHCRRHAREGRGGLVRIVTNQSIYRHA